jgi:threonyl-tRNA synthetase
MVHRAILGSVERMFGILIEHTAGKWPFWLSPRQVLICPVGERHADYARMLAEQLQRPTAGGMGGKQQGSSSSSNGGSVRAAASATPLPHADTGLYVDVDESARTIPKRVRAGQVAQYNLIAVVGDAEVAAGTVALRFRDAGAWTAFQRAWRVVDPAAAEAAVAAAAAAAAAQAAKSSGDGSVAGADASKTAPAGKRGKTLAGGVPGEGEGEGGEKAGPPLVSVTPEVLRAVAQYMLAAYM